MNWYWEWKWSLVLTLKIRGARIDLDFPRIYVWDCNDIKGVNVTLFYWIIYIHYFTEIHIIFYWIYTHTILLNLYTYTILLNHTELYILFYWSINPILLNYKSYLYWTIHPTIFLPLKNAQDPIRIQFHLVNHFLQRYWNHISRWKIFLK